MTLQETQQLLSVLRTNYPNTFRNQTKNESYDYLQLWAEAFKNDNANAVIKAVKKIIYEDTREFAPNIAQVKKMIQEEIEIHPKALENKNYSQGFNMCQRTGKICPLDSTWGWILINFD